MENIPNCVYNAILINLSFVGLVNLDEFVGQEGIDGNAAFVFILVFPMYLFLRFSPVFFRSTPLCKQHVPLNELFNEFKFHCTLRNKRTFFSFKAIVQ